jgi:four helix bundle protein
VNQKAEELKARTRRFLWDVIGLVKTFPSTVDAEIIGRQLIRAAAGVAGNYRSACRARSHAEFTARIGVVLDEADESELWLSVVRDVPIDTSPLVERLRQEGMELSAIFYRANLTARNRSSARQ